MFGFGRKKRITNAQLEKATQKASGLINRTRNTFRSLFVTDLKHEDKEGLQYAEAQILVLALYLNLIEYCLLDALYDDGTISALRSAETKALTHAQHRKAISEVFHDFGPLARLNIDMRYRYMLVDKLFTEEEAGFFGRFSFYAQDMLDQHFYQHRSAGLLDTKWLHFIKLCADGDGASAFELFEG